MANNMIIESLNRRIARYEQSNVSLQAKIDRFVPKGFDMSLAEKYIVSNNVAIARCREQLQQEAR